MTKAASGEGRVLRSAMWGWADQAVSSLTNFVVGILIARSLSPNSFGAFGLGFAFYALALNMTRAFASQPLTIRYSSATPGARHGAAREAAGASLVLGAGTSILCLVIASVTTGALREVFAALAIVLPGLMLQDTWRFTFFTQARPGAALVNDVVWAITLVPLLALAPAMLFGSVFWMTLLWGGTATLAAAVGILQAGVIPAPMAARRWLRAHRDLGSRFLTESAIAVAAAQAVLFGLGALAGLAAVAAVRSAQLLLGPLNIVVQGGALFSVAEVARAAALSTEHVARFAVRLSAVLSVIGIAWTLFVLSIPESTGVAVLGENWDGAQQVILPVGVAFVALCGATGASVALRGLAEAGRILRAGTIASTCTVVFGLVGAFAAGASGAAWGMAAATTIGAVATWFELRFAMATSART